MNLTTRKITTGMLIAAALCSSAAWAVSYVGVSVANVVYTRKGIDPIPPGSIHVFSCMLHDGILHVERGRYPAKPISSELSANLLELFGSGWGIDVGLEDGIDVAIGTLYSPLWWRPAFHRAGGMNALTLPIWQITVVLTVSLAALFYRGPLRAVYRRRMGLCCTCGYNLTGNTTGQCPECGADCSVR